jgi:RNA polymerase sigma factor (sigma-70 family)
MKPTQISKSLLAIKDLNMTNREFDKLYRDHYKMILKIASNYSKDQINKEDLFQEGLIGLCIGAAKYRPEMRAKLSSYVYFWIRQRIAKYASENKNITVPVHILSRTKKRNPTLYAEYERLRSTSSLDELVYNKQNNDTMSFGQLIGAY